MAEHFEVSRRTIERELSALQQAGVPIYATPGRRGGYVLDLQHTLPPLNLSAYLIGRGILGNMNGSAMNR